MTDWNNRSPVPRAMLNPALIASILASAATGYHREAGEAMLFPLSFLVAPLVLHRGTREALPASMASHLAVWITNHPAIRAGFPARARTLTDPVLEGIRFGSRNGILSLDGAGISAPKRLKQSSGDVQAMRLKAVFVGRWLTKLDRPATAFALLGVTV